MLFQLSITITTKAKLPNLPVSCSLTKEFKNSTLKDKHTINIPSISSNSRVDFISIEPPMIINQSNSHMANKFSAAIWHFLIVENKNNNKKKNMTTFVNAPMAHNRIHTCQGHATSHIKSMQKVQSSQAKHYGLMCMCPNDAM